MENSKFAPKMTGVALALAAAGIISGCQTPTETTQAAPAASNTTDLVHCYGVNVCKGHNDCGTADNSCGGKAACKGSGFVATPSKACGDIGGTVKDDWVGEIAKTDLVHCYGVNTCKGHNDCGTAENSCAGKAACKGHGFVATTEKSCSDVGGEVGA